MMKMPAATTIEPLIVSVQPAESGGKTVYRLRASGGDARALCARLKAAGESCTII